ncbi:fibronectin type III domain-containing protein [Marinobacter halodurans]|uniref:Fibronectin type III domain-containing protein n=1 Tax=Marinobacter halodurans TaxID=2528979 RepID=A0ABY1ZH50_9GAMM|nr:fibronectin type III domain-containing protein [Marinobacter halodurans]TBW52209.1 fibronectin type III domain-containing protein [Marinobacter halodurans]
MSYTTPSRARHALLLPLFFATLFITGCKGGGSSSDSAYKASSDTGGDAAALSEPREAATSNLQWVAPATRADGSKLYVGEIRGYRIYYKLKYQDNYQAISVNGSDETTYPLKGFEPGAYEFAVTTVDIDGLESQPSQVIAVNII